MKWYRQYPNVWLVDNRTNEREEWENMVKIGLYGEGEVRERIFRI